MFKRLPEADEATIEFHFDGQAYRAVAGDSLAAALLANGIGQFGRNAADNSPRGPHCMIGNCFDCLVLLADGRTAQACLTPVAAGMRVRPYDPATAGSPE